MSQENVEIVRAALEAAQRGDEAAVMDSMAPDIEGRVWSQGVGDDAFHGHEGLRKWMADFLSAWEKAELEIVELIDAGGDDEVVARLRWRLEGKTSRLETEMDYWAIYGLREGKIASYRQVSRKRALAAVGLSE
jgi:ketosteroid isomerase-like protein